MLQRAPTPSAAAGGSAAAVLDLHRAAGRRRSASTWPGRRRRPAPSTLSAYQFNRIKGPLPIGSPVPTTALVDVQFADAQVGFALALHGGDVLLAATTDGGATWSVRNDHMPPGLGTDTGYPGQFEFVGFTGYLWGARSGSGMPLWVTKNDGLTWQQASPMSAYVYDVSAIGLNAWALAGTCPVSVVEEPGSTVRRRDGGDARRRHDVDDARSH